jgi:glycerophosphoryl diester phosphodiesterase
MMGKGPVVTAHSGCMGSAPNSADHIRCALAEGADIVELDIRLSGAGELMFCHDAASAGGATGAGGTQGTGNFDLDSAFDMLEGTGCILNLDVKEIGAALASAVIARRRGKEDSILFSGLAESDTLFMKERLPRFRYLLNADAVLPSTGYGETEIREACRIAFENSCCGINLDFRSATRGLLEYTRRRCIPVVLWTPDTEEDIARVLDLNPFSITTNRPDILARLINRGAKQ